MSRANQLLMGVAAAGVLGLATAGATAVANADSGGPDSGASSSSGAGKSSAAGPRAQARSARAGNSSTGGSSSAASARVASLRDKVVNPAFSVPPVFSVPESPLPVGPVSPAAATSGEIVGGLTGRSRAAAARVAQVQTYVAAGDPNHVLVIGIDGTNLSAILADDANQNLFELIGTGTTAASTIVGHTTISNPSWTGVLTGVWGETAGVTANVFTPWTYDTWPTVFNQLETYDPDIQTSSISNWDVIAKISGAGNIPADLIKYYAPVTVEEYNEADNQVGQASVLQIQNTSALESSFQFTYFGGVDEAGHLHGAGSPEYTAALTNVDENIGAIMAAIEAWETAHPTATPWTVILTTDHGQNPDRTGILAHGFQTPIETTTFVIANGPTFQPGAINNTYINVDVTPTVTALLGLAPEPYSAGKPLMDRSASDYRPILPGEEALHQALTDAIGMYGYPDIVEELALNWRTVATTIPWLIYTAFDSVASSVPDFLADAVLFIGAICYNIAYIPAQIVARITGVTGNAIIPEDWWPWTPTPGTQSESPAAATSLEALAS